MTLVADASVIVKIHVAEQGSDAAIRVVAGDTIEAPDIVLAELGNVAWRLHRKGAIGWKQAERLVGNSPGLFARLWPVEPLIGRGLEIARDLDHSIYDCLYPALSDRLGAPLITADRRLLARVRGTPRQASAMDLYTL